MKVDSGYKDISFVQRHANHFVSKSFSTTYHGHFSSVGHVMMQPPSSFLQLGDAIPCSF